MNREYIAAYSRTLKEGLVTVEVVDNNINCDVQPIPMELYGSAAIDEMICGGETIGFNILSSCWHLNPNGTWTAGKNMLERRLHLTLSKVEDKIIAIGGVTTNHVGQIIALKSIEQYSLVENDGWLRMKYSPVKIYGHCTVMLNTSHLMVLGGYQDDQVNLDEH